MEGHFSFTKPHPANPLLRPKDLPLRVLVMTSFIPGEPCTSSSSSPPFSLPSLQPPNENKMTTLYQTQPGWHRNFPLIGRGQSKTDRHKIRCVYGLHMIHVSTSAATNILGFPKPEVMNQVFCPTKIKTSTYSILNDPMTNWEILTFVKLELECLTFIYLFIFGSTLQLYYPPWWKCVICVQ